MILPEKATGDNALYRLRTLLLALGGSCRMEILMQLSRGPMDVTALVEALELDYSPISQGLKILRECGLVTMRREGLRHIYHLCASVRLVREKHDYLWVQCRLGTIAISLEELQVTPTATQPPQVVTVPKKSPKHQNEKTDSRSKK